MCTLTVELAKKAHSAIEALRRRVREAIARQEASFHCGVYTGCGPEGLFNEMRTELAITPASHPTFRPSLTYDANRNIFTMKVPASRIAAHKDVMVTSYLLRAHADYVLSDIVHDHIKRNIIAREFSDSVQFGRFSDFMRQLASYESFERMHDSDIPLSLVLGFIAKHYYGTSLVSLYGITRTYEPDSLEYQLVQTHQVGQLQPHYDCLFSAYFEGHHNITASRAQHSLVDNGAGKQAIIVTNPVWSDSNSSYKKSKPLASIIRTVVWSNDALSRDGFMNDFLAGSTRHFLH